MKIIGIIISLFFTFLGFTQKSYDFSIPLPPNENSISTVSSELYGIYHSIEGDGYYEFNEFGVWIISTVYSSISKEMVRENAKYTVRNGYIFGVIINDSIPCVLEEDRYHFGIKNKDLLIGKGSKNSLKKLADRTYILNFEENEKYTPTLLTFVGKKLEVKQFDYDNYTTAFDQFKLFTSNKIGSVEFITISPNKKDWRKFDYEQEIFGKTREYIRF